jgi:hypothetical protein
MILIMRRTGAQARTEGLNPDGWAATNYAVTDGQTCVGRIYSEMIHGELKWCWFMQTEPAVPPNSGTADTLDEAKTAFKKRYARVRGS